MSINKNILPHFIQEQYKNGRFQGQFEAATLFLDLSGFTTMTQDLMAHGNLGAETLVTALNDVFDPIVDTIYAHQGFISHFAGDACLAIFPFTTDSTSHKQQIVKQAIRASQISQQQIVKQGKHVTPLGSFPLTVKMGIGVGDVEWGIIGATRQKTWVFWGACVEEAIAGQKLASENQLLVSRKVFSFVSHNEPNPPNAFYPLSTLPHIETAVAHASPIPSLDQEIATRFFPTRLFQMRAQGEFRYAAVIFITFADLLNFELLNQFVAHTMTTATQFGGQLNRIEFGDKGNSIFLSFGAPVTHENDLERALNFMDYWQSNLPAPMTRQQWRAGISYGLVYAGFVGGQKRSEYTTLGHITNLASRLREQAGWGEVWVSERIAKQPQFHFTHLGDYKMKGVNIPLPVYQFMGRKSVESAVFSQEIIGREQELAQLQRQADVLQNGRFAGTLIIYGEAGMGKSHLAHAWYRMIPFAASWYVGQTDSILQAPFNPFIYFLRRYFHQFPDNTVAENKANFENQLAFLNQQLSVQNHAHALHLQSELNRLTSILGALIGLPQPKNSLYQKLDASGRYHNSILAIKLVFQAESLRQPLIFVLEDAHWLDSASQATLKQMTTQMDSFPCLFIITTRYTDDGRKPNFTLSSDAPLTHLELKLITPDDIDKIAEQILDTPIAPSLNRLLWEKTGANPFFIQQFLYYFQENNRLQLSPDNLLTLKTDLPTLPTEITTILLARLDRLSDQLQQVVKVASVIGREFEVRILSYLLQRDVTVEVIEAQSQQIWVPVDDGRYIFKHILLQNVAYDMQLRQRLRQLHLEIGMAYEQLFAGNLAPYYSELAYHFRQADVAEKEQVYAFLAGKQMAAQFANEAAVHLFSQALACVAADDTLAEFEILLEREQTYNQMGLREKQLADLNRLVECSMAWVIGDEETNGRLATIYYRRAQYAHLISDYDHAIAAAQQGIELMKPYPPSQQLAACYLIWGRVVMLQGEYDLAERQMRSALQVARSANLAQEEANTIRNIGIIYYYLGDYDQAQDYWEKALALYERIEDRYGASLSLHNIGVNLFTRSDYDGAQKYWHAYLSICQEMGARFEEANGFNNLGRTAMEQGQFSLAYDHFQTSLQLYRDVDSLPGEARLYNNLGTLYRLRGDMTQAFIYHQNALTIFKDIGDRLGMGHSQQNLGNDKNHAGEFALAKPFYEEALQIYIDINARSDQADAYHYLGVVAAQEEDWETAVSNLQKAITMRTELKQNMWLMESQIELAWVLQQQDSVVHGQEIEQLITAVLTNHEAHRGLGVKDYFQFYWRTYLVLQHQNHPLCPTWLHAPFAELQTRAVELDPTEQEAFWQNIVAHKNIRIACTPINRGGAEDAEKKRK